MTTKTTLKASIARLALIVLGLSLLPLTAAQAAQITGRKMTISSSAPSATAVSYTFNFTVPTSGTAIKSFAVNICTTASGTCVTPTGFDNSTSTLSSQPTNLGAGTGWTVNTSTAGSLRIVNASNSTNPTSPQTVVFGGITNPTATNTTFYGRIITYSDAAWSTPVDNGVVTASTATQIVLTGIMPESLIFCTGATITGTDCSTASPGAVSFNQEFSPTATAYATSQMVASTNAGTGYNITVNGATLTSGGSTIAAMGTATTSTIGLGQFGMNFMVNTTPAVGTALTPTSNTTNYRGQPLTGYGTSNTFKYVNGDSVANSGNSSLGPTDAQSYTASYIVNVSGSQTAGTYTATLTYICTSTF